MWTSHPWVYEIDDTLPPGPEPGVAPRVMVVGTRLQGAPLSSLVLAALKRTQCWAGCRRLSPSVAMSTGRCGEGRQLLLVTQLVRASGHVLNIVY